MREIAALCAPVTVRHASPPTVAAVPRVYATFMQLSCLKAHLQAGFVAYLGDTFQASISDSLITGIDNVDSLSLTLVTGTRVYNQVPLLTQWSRLR